MDMRLLKQANAVVIGYRRAHGEKVPMSIFDDPAGARAVLERGLSGEDAELKTACVEMAKTMGLSLSAAKATAAPAGVDPAAASARPAAQAPAKPPAASGMTPAQWGVIEEAAIKVGGPICKMLVGQVRDEGAASFDEAIDKVAEMMGGGSMGAELKREARAVKR